MSRDHRRRQPRSPWLDDPPGWFPSTWRFDSSHARRSRVRVFCAFVNDTSGWINARSIDRRNDHATHESRVSHCRARARARNECTDRIVFFSRRFDFRCITVTNQDSKNTHDPSPSKTRPDLNERDAERARTHGKTAERTKMTDASTTRRRRRVAHTRRTRAEPFARSTVKSILGGTRRVIIQKKRIPRRVANSRQKR